MRAVRFEPERKLAAVRRLRPIGFDHWVMPLLRLLKDFSEATGVRIISRQGFRWAY